MKSLQILMLDHADELLKTVRNNYGTFLKIKELWVIEYSIHDFHIVLEVSSESLSYEFSEWFQCLIIHFVTVLHLLH